jgi:hypothetical protein
MAVIFPDRLLKRNICLFLIYVVHLTDDFGLNALQAVQSQVQSWLYITYFVLQNVIKY